METTEAILAQIAKPEHIVEPLNLKEKFQNNKDELYVYRTVHIPLWGWLPLGPDWERSPLTPYRLGANSWKDYYQTDGVNPLVFMVQFMMLLVEHAKLEGGFICNVDHDGQPEEYKKVCVAMAKKMTGCAKKGDLELIDKYVEKTHKVDLRFIHDVNYEKQVLAKQMSNAKKKQSLAQLKNKKKKKKAAKPKKKPKRTYVTLVNEMLKEAGFGEYNFVPVSNHGQEVTFHPEEEEDEETPSPVASPLGRGGLEEVDENELSEAQEVDDEEAEREDREGARQEEGEIDEETLVPKVPYKGPPGRVAKISMTITEIPYSEDNQQIVGMMVTFIIRDPAVNPGLFYKHCMENLSARSLRSQKQYGNFKAEMFPEYADHMLSFWPAGNRTNLQTYGHIITKCYPEFVNQYYQGDYGLFEEAMRLEGDTHFHIYNLFTPEFAIQKLREAGGCPLVLGRASDWLDRDEGIVKFPSIGGVRTWKPRHMATIWYTKEFQGFSGHYFPFVDMKSDFMRALCSGVHMAEFLSGASDLSKLKKSRMDKALEDDMLVLKSFINSKRDGLDYETNNEIIHAAFEADYINGLVKEYYPELHYHDTLHEVQELVKQYGLQWRLHLGLDPELAARVEECELYNTILKTTQEARRKTFYNIVKLDENPDALKISPPMKALVKWYQDVNETKLPNMTRPYTCIDSDLDPFGNTMLYQLFVYTRFAKVLQPMICILSEGLFSCYDAFQGELSYNQMTYGRYDVGKTHTAINILINFSTIPGTVIEQPLATKASDTTHKHSHDEIVATDECPEWIVSEIEAKKNPDLVNKEKVKMTRGRLVQKTFVFKDLPSGRRLRWSEDVKTDHKKALVLVSNHPPDSKKALSSRFHRFIMKQPNVSPAEMKGYVDEWLKSDAKTYLHINQFLSAMLKKLAAVGGILPEVEMELFDDISTRVLKYLEKRNAMSHESGPRSLEIMKPFLRQLVYKMAIRYAFDFEWSENYMKKFSLEQLAAVQPFLYTTVSQVWFVWTACASEWINDDYCNVLKAMMMEAYPAWQQGVSNVYSIYERDINNSIRFKTTANDIPPSASEAGDMVQYDKFLINLNYMCLEGSEDIIAQKVAQHTNPKLEPDQIKGIFKRLSEIQKRPEKGGFAPQKMGTFAKWHKYNGRGPHASKNTGDGCPTEYQITNDDKDTPRTRDDVPCLAEGLTLPIVDRSDLRRNKLYFMPDMESFFQQDIITEALRYATYCGTTKPGKILLGFTTPNDTTRLEAEFLEQKQLDDYLKDLDEDAGFSLRPNGKWKSDNPYAVSRREGIVYNRRAAFTDFDITIATNIQAAPRAPGDESWKTRSQSGARGMSKDCEVVRDLDVRSAERQHIRCGRPLDEPVRTPQWIAEKTGNNSLNLDYLVDDVSQKSIKEEKWNATITPGQREEQSRARFKSRRTVSRSQQQNNVIQQQAQQVRDAIRNRNINGGGGGGSLGTLSGAPPSSSKSSLNKRSRQKTNERVFNFSRDFEDDE